MTESKPANYSFQKIAGIIEILISGYWLMYNVSTFYNYQMHPEILWAFRIPDFILALNGLTGLIGVWFGIKLYTLRQSIIRSYLVPLAFFVTIQVLYDWTI